MNQRTAKSARRTLAQLQPTTGKLWLTRRNH